MFFKSCFLAFLVLLSCSVFAQEGTVVRVIDGDTLVLLTGDKEEIKVRLTEIDAPERKQAFGTKSKEALARLCASKTASLSDTSKDRYGRTLARVNCAGTDVNAYMVKVGLAWVYDRYVKDRSLYDLQETAKSKRLGLWADDSPTPPWIYRRNK